jgi:superfamily II DNA or RNA helicase
MTTNRCEAAAGHRRDSLGILRDGRGVRRDCSGGKLGCGDGDWETEVIRVSFDTSNLADYRKFLAVRRCPVYEFRGSDAYVPDEYAAEILGAKAVRTADTDYEPSPFLFDYQADIARTDIAKRSFANFVYPGYGKTLIFLEYARHLLKKFRGRPILIVSPLMVIPQTLEEAEKFYPGIGIKQLPVSKVQDFCDRGRGIAITNYEAFTQSLRPGRVVGLILDESAMLAPMYGKWATNILKFSAGLDWRLGNTGTPAPNDRIEYANHAVFTGCAKTTNEFLATYFVNRGQTGERWEIKPHAVARFYRDLSHWCIFMSNPATYGWRDNADNIPPIHTHIHRVDLTEGQRKAVADMTGRLFVSEIGGIGQRAKIGQIAKGRYKGEAVETLKPQFIRDLVDSWKGESTIIWCRYNDEQAMMERAFPEAASIKGQTPIDERIEMIAAFKSGQVPQMISKPKCIGLGLNLQVATRQVFNGLWDSYIDFIQALKRSNRVGSTRPLNAHIVTTEIEEPMVQTVLTKAKRVEEDERIQEAMFRDNRWQL